MTYLIKIITKSEKINIAKQQLEQTQDLELLFINNSIALFISIKTN